MRIIGGSARSLALVAPPSGTRPTSDRVREALFSSLDARDAIRGARVLDLYAGSGALALEAISRGASSAVLVERNGKAAAVARKNAAQVKGSGANGVVDVITQPVASYLTTATGPFDLVFADPPYDLSPDELGRTLDLVGPLLDEHAYLIVERSTRGATLVEPVALEIVDQRIYGETTLWWLAPLSP